MPNRAGLLIVVIALLGALAYSGLSVAPTSPYHLHDGAAEPPPNFSPGGQGAAFSNPHGGALSPQPAPSGPATIVLAMTADKPRARSGDVLTYTLWFNNTGSELARQIWINDSLPQAMTYLSDNASSIGGWRTGNYNWTFTNQLPGTRYFRLQASLNGGLAPGSVLTNQASLNYTDGSGAPRPGSRVAVGTLVSSPETGIAWLLWVLLAVGLIVGPLIFFLFLRPRGRIEEIFLVHYDGTLMAHLSRTIMPDKDRDVLTGMLTAIQDFIRDAFVRSPGEELRELSFGQQRIHIQRGAHSYLAVVSRGRTPWGLPERMKETLAKIEGMFPKVMAHWSGNPEDLAAASGILSAGLLKRRYLAIFHRPKRE